ncbi:hypothetical protein C4R89_11780 [Clostridioides difficile]|nr:hypothetical protein [Clostridioides difficile]
MSGYLIVLLVFVNVGIWLFSYDVRLIFSDIFYCLFL